MPRPARPWFRFYVEAVDDRKIRRLSPAQRWLWVAILAAARESPSPGRLLIAGNVPMTFQELAAYADLDPRSVRTGVELMTNLDMVTIESDVIVVTNFAHRQYESDNVTARTRAHRERSKERSNEQPNDVPRNVRRNTPETETEAETDKRTTYVDLEGGSTSTRATKPPPEFCPEHPTGTTRPCRACAAARESREAWDNDQRATEARAREQRIRQAQDATIDQDRQAPVYTPAARQAIAAARANLAREPHKTNEQAGV